MKRFIINSTVIILLLGAVSVILNYAYRNIIKRDSTNQIIDKQFNDNLNRISILFMGDSHIMNGVDCRIIPNSFNYATGEESTIQNYYRLKSIIDSGFVPDTIIINIDPATFSSFRLKKIKHSEYWVDKINYFEIAKTLRDRSFYVKWLGGKYFSFVGNYHIFLRYFLTKKKQRNPVYLGYKPRYENFANDMNRKSAGIDRANLYLKNYNVLSPSLTIYFEKFLSLCDSNNIKLFVIKMPLSMEYLNGVKRLINIDNYYNDVLQMLNNHPSYVGIFDFQEIFLEHPEYFHNPDHLNDTGAKILSGYIKEEIKKTK
ncbi:MAG: hypothetical protein Kow0068_07090 [Marinilabiliales bacterium]